MSMFADVGFSAGGQFEDPEPGRAFRDDGYSRRTVTNFVSDRYVAGASHHPTDGISWSWRITGRVVKQDGTIRADGRRGGCRVPADAVPAEVKQALATKIEREAADCLVQIERYVRASVLLRG